MDKNNIKEALAAEAIANAARKTPYWQRFSRFIGWNPNKGTHAPAYKQGEREVARRQKQPLVTHKVQTTEKPEGAFEGRRWDPKFNYERRHSANMRKLDITAKKRLKLHGYKGEKHA